MTKFYSIFSFIFVILSLTLLYLLINEDKIDRLWYNNFSNIKYCFDKNYNINELEKAIIRTHMDKIEDLMTTDCKCITFNEVDIGSADIIIRTGSRSYVTFSKNNKIMFLSNIKNFKIFFHEIMHTLYIFHEHQRFDRDEYVFVNEKNDNYDIKQTSYEKYVPFNYFSLMLYNLKFKYSSLLKLPSDWDNEPYDINNLEIYKIHLAINSWFREMTFGLVKISTKICKTPIIPEPIPMNNSDIIKLKEDINRLRNINKDDVDRYINITVNICGKYKYWPLNYPLIPINSLFLEHSLICVHYDKFSEDLQFY